MKSVHEAKAEFKIEFEDGSSATLCLADPGSSVAVRDKNNAVEYLGYVCDSRFGERAMESIYRDPISLRPLQNWDIGHRILIPSGKSKTNKIAQSMNSL